MKKEPLSLITIKTLLAVIIFTGVGTIIVGGGWLIGKQGKGIPMSNELRCDNLSKEIGEKMGKLDKSCQSDEDCKTVELLRLIQAGGTYPLCVNKKETVEDIRSLQDLYYKRCKIFLPDIRVKPALFYGCGCRDNVCVGVNKKSKDVTITTDKTEYEQGDAIRLSIKNNSGENVCFESCNTYYFQKKNVIWKEYLTKRCEVNFITKCIDHSEVEEFKGRLSEVDFKEGVYKIAVPIYTDCQNEEFPCKENKTIYSNEFTIKEK